MLRRLHKEQPQDFAFAPANLAWANAQIAKYPTGRQASAIIPLLWRAQEQEGWLTRPAIEYVAGMLGMAYMRALEVATFYFMFQLQPVGSIAHVQVCGTTSCMICGAEDLISVCKEAIAANPHDLSQDGKFSWEEVECLGACANAPMVQIGKDYYEDLTADSLRKLLAAFSRGEVPKPGSQIGRFASEPAGGLTALTAQSGEAFNGSVARAVSFGDTIKRIQGDEVPMLTRPAVQAVATDKPMGLDAPQNGQADDLKQIKGVGPKLEAMLNRMGFYHFGQIAAWTEAELAWVDDNIEGFKGRASRDEWVAQARILASGGETAFSKKVEDGGVY